MIKIIQPPHGKVAEKVRSWSSIKTDAQLLRNFIKETEKHVTGYYKTAYAISHAQVSWLPKTFFVINENNKKLIKSFGHWCIINLRILETKEPVCYNEACMSFPYRKPRTTDRFNKVKVVYWVPFLWWSRPVFRTFSGLEAFIVQHEEEHSLGKNIYGKTPIEV